MCDRFTDLNLPPMMLQAMGRHGSFTLLDPTKTTLSVTGSIGDYVAHPDATQNHQWTFQWTAPASDIGPMTFYWAGNDANGIDTTPPAGDSIYLAQKTIFATPGAGINPVSSELGDVKIYLLFAQPICNWSSTC